MTRSTLEEGAFQFPPLNTPRDALNFTEFPSIVAELPSNSSTRWSTSPSHRSPDTEDESPTDGPLRSEDTDEVARLGVRCAAIDLNGGSVIGRLQMEMEQDHLDEEAVLLCVQHLSALNPNQHDAQLVAMTLQQLLVKARSSPRIIQAWAPLVMKLLESKEAFRALFRLDFPLFSGLTQTIGLYLQVEELCCSLLSLLCTLHLAGSASDRHAEIRAFLATLMRAVEAQATSEPLLRLFTTSVNKILNKFGPNVVEYLVDFGVCPLLTRLLSNSLDATKDAYCDSRDTVLACYLDCLSAANSAFVPIWKLHNTSLQTTVLKIWREGLQCGHTAYLIFATTATTYWTKESRIRAVLPLHDVCQLLEVNISGFGNHTAVLVATLQSIEGYAVLHRSTRPHWEAAVFLSFARHNAETASICVSICNILRVSLAELPVALCCDIWYWLCEVLSAPRNAALVSAGLALATELVKRLCSEQSLLDLEMANGIIISLRNSNVSDMLARRSAASFLIQLMDCDAKSADTFVHRAAAQDVMPWIQDCLDDEHIAVCACQFIRLNLYMLRDDVDAARSFVATNEISLLLVELLSEHTDSLGLCLACCELMLALCALQDEFCAILADSGAAELLLRAVKLQQEDVRRLCPAVHSLLELFKGVSEGMDSRIYKHRDYRAFLQVFGIPRSITTVARKQAKIVIVEAADLDSIESSLCCGLDVVEYHMSYVDCEMK